MARLPVLALADDIARALIKGNALLCAEPGAGKSTGLPLALLLDPVFNTRPDGSVGGKIILLEPRRLAARSVAQRLATHLGETVGQRIGLRMRADTRVSAQTQLTVVTEGVLTRVLQDDPGLDGIALVIFDEFHERSLHADLGLALCLEVQQALRNDLRLLLMSATLDAGLLQAQLADIQPFHCPVRQHPIETIWVGEQTAPLPQRVVHTVLNALAEQAGDVLVFLPGVAEINRTATLLQPRLESNITLHRLHSGVSSTAQAAATAPASTLHRRVILATSLAETSLTIDGVRVVVDSGLERRGRIDTSTGAQRLETVMASQASATQRAGRAGRTAAGVCYRLWNESGHSRRPAQWQPEIERADLAPLLMELGLWGVSADHALPWLEPPPPASLSRAKALMGRLGLWNTGKLTERGRVVAGLPIHPRLGCMLVWATEHGMIEKACRLAVWIEERHTGLDSIDLEPALIQVLPSGLQKRADQLASLLTNRAGLKSTRRGPIASDTHPSAAVVLAQAFPDWLAQKRPGEAGRFLLACGAGAVVNEADPLAFSPWLVAAQMGGTGPQARIFQALALDMDELERFSPEWFVSRDHLDWDVRQQRVLAERRVMLGSLVVDARPIHDISAQDRAVALLAGIRKGGSNCLPWTDACREWQARVQRMQGLPADRQVDDQGPVTEYPDVNDAALITGLDTWLLPWLQGIGSMKALQQLDLYQALKAMLDYRQQRLMDDWLPGRYTVPSGSSIRLSYVRPGNPVLSVRLQEMLGCAENPSIARGQIRLKVELLSPARRPVQVTEDLANFWSNSYPEVKKEMAGRYPKHLWPDDPLAAPPTTHTRRNGKPSSS